MKPLSTEETTPRIAGRLHSADRDVRGREVPLGHLRAVSGRDGLVL